MLTESSSKWMRVVQAGAILGAALSLTPLAGAQQRAQMVISEIKRDPNEIIGLKSQATLFAEHNNDAESRARLESVVDGLMIAAIEDYDVAGASVAVVRDGRTAVLKAYGTARLTPEVTPATPDTLFQIASVSKLPVYIAGMQQVESGAIKLDDPVNAHLPAKLRLPDQGFSEPIRVRDLFAHTGGFEDLALGHLFAGKPEDLTDIDTYLVNHRPKRVRAPGGSPSYSNYSLILLGRIVQEKSGLAFADYMEQKVLRPLGMAESSYRDPYTDEIAKAGGLAAPLTARQQSYLSQQLKGAPGAWNVAHTELTSHAAPAGGLRASARDMAEFMLSLENPKRFEAAGVLDQATFESMIAGPSVDGTPRVLHGFIPYEFPGGRRGFGHGGAMAYSASDLVIVPDLKLGVFVTTNTRGGFSFAYHLANRIVQGIAPLEETAPVRNEETKAAAKALAGNWISTRRAYRSTERSMLTPGAAPSIKAKEDGDLLIGGLGSPAQRYVPEGGGLWRPVKPGGWRIKAEKGADGKTRLVSTSGVNTFERAGFWQSGTTLLLPLIIAMLTALLALYGWPGRWQTRAESRTVSPAYARYGARALDAAVPLWLAGIGTYIVTLLGAASDGGASLLFSYPGGIGTAAWIIALAVLATLIGWLSAPALFANDGWTLWRRLKQGAALAVFSVAALACWHLGLIGFQAS